MRLHGMGPVVYMAATKLFVGALGMGLAFAPAALYPYYVHHAHFWGLSAADDQSIAGLIMAVEQSIVMGIALVVLFARALAESEREQQRRERYRSLRRAARPVVSLLLTTVGLTFRGGLVSAGPFALYASAQALRMPL